MQSKSKTLQLLDGQVSFAKIPTFMTFSYRDWTVDRFEILSRIQKKFDSVAVRSSCTAEDTFEKSLAGSFETILSVNAKCASSLISAIDSVFNSYLQHGFKSIEREEILIQAMVEKVCCSGVIFTHNVDNGAPYYVISYNDDNADTAAVTGGTSIPTTVYVHHSTPQHMYQSDRIIRLIALTNELQAALSLKFLDIEFAISRDGVLHLLQARPISTVSSWTEFASDVNTLGIQECLHVFNEICGDDGNIIGSSSILSNMADWNPAELIGTRPSALALSLFRLLISDSNWRLGRSSLGYKDIRGVELVHDLLGQPYVDVRASLNSLLLDKLNLNVQEKIVNQAIEILRQTPALHDKLEFDVAVTCFDFDLADRLQRDFSNLTPDEAVSVIEAYREFTQEIVKSKFGLLDANEISELAKECSIVDVSLSNRSFLSSFNGELELAQRSARIFSRLARLGFVAEAILKSLIKKDVLTADRVSLFKSTFQTILSDFTSDVQLLRSGESSRVEFMLKYGHLRPGTFDINSPCYRDRVDVFSGCKVRPRENKPVAFLLTNEEEQRFKDLQIQANFCVSLKPLEVLEFCKSSIEQREFGKFSFSRHISSILETINAWGQTNYLSRADLSCINIKAFIAVLESCKFEENAKPVKKMLRKGDQLERRHQIKLSPVIHCLENFFVVPLQRAIPNFVTTKAVEGWACHITPDSVVTGSLDGAVVCIRNADPGFDWIFSHNISGLVTEYGGVNLHMAIRCAEQNLPAAIGCGEILYERCVKARIIRLNCDTQSVTFL